MTQRERVVDTKDSAVKVGVYDSTPTTATTTTTAVTTDTKPTDLIRWGPILGGLFAALATLITLGVLGLAVGLSAYNANDPLGGFGIGAGVWGAITALIAFFCPTTRSPRRCSIVTNFCFSPSCKRLTGMPVHDETIRAISSSVTSSLSNAP